MLANKSHCFLKLNENRVPQAAFLWHCMFTPGGQEVLMTDRTRNQAGFTLMLLMMKEDPSFCEWKEKYEWVQQWETVKRGWHPNPRHFTQRGYATPSTRQSQVAFASSGTGMCSVLYSTPDLVAIQLFLRHQTGCRSAGFSLWMAWTN